VDFLLAYLTAKKEMFTQVDDQQVTRRNKEREGAVKSSERFVTDRQKSKKKNQSAQSTPGQKERAASANKEDENQGKKMGGLLGKNK